MSLQELAPSQIPEWFAYQLAPESAVYNVSFNHFFLDRVDRAAFLAAWQQLLDRHDVFRLRLGYAEGRPGQYLGEPQVLDPARLFIDRTGLAAEQVLAEQERLAREYALAPFDFANDVLYRLHLVAYPGDEYQLLFTVHHIIWDETSTLNLIREFASLYTAACQGRQAQLPPLRGSFLDYARRSNEALHSGELEVHRRYWMAQFADLPAPLELPTDRPRPVVQTYNGNTAKTWLPRALARDLGRFCANRNSTPFMFLLAALNLYLHRVCGQDDLVLGCPIAGRSPQDQGNLGCYAVPMPIRTRIAPDMTFATLLEQVAGTVLEAFEHYRYPCVNVIEALDHHKDLSRPKLFSVMAGVQNDKSDFVSIDLGQGQLYPKEIFAAENHGARFDLAIGLDPVGSDVKFFCTYNSDLFDAATVERLLDSLQTLFQAVIADPGQPLASYPLLSDEAARQVLQGFNPPTPLADPATGTVLDLIEAQGRQNPAAPALATTDGSLERAALAREVDHLARALAGHGIEGGQAVGVLLDGGAEAVIALLAILRLGALYVPLHPDWPASRLQAVATQAGMRWVVSREAWQRQAQELARPVLVMEHLPRQAPGQPRLASQATPGQLAYLLFTSGTTGTPKGIPAGHAGLLALVQATQARYALKPGERMLFWTAPTFDASLLDMLWPLCAGAEVVPWPAGLARTADNLLQVLREQRITALQTVPAMLEALVEAARRGAERLPDLRLIICGAAALHRSLAERTLATFDCRLANHYGPTEATVDALWHDCGQPCAGDRVPIGKPLPHVQAFILDRHDQPLPIGVPGQLCLASTGLSPGYWQAPEQTRLAFFEKALLPGQPALRLYRTGDLARFDGEGLVHYIGRLDHQVKVRGNRVELGDIESALASHPDVARAAVTWQEEDGGRLRAFVELRERQVARIEARNQVLRQFSVAQRPELRVHMNLIHQGTWPRYFAGSPVLAAHWESLYSLFPHYQFCLVDDNDQVACVANGVPLHWDGEQQSVPEGWDAALQLALHQHQAGIPPNTVVGLAGIVAEHCQGQGLASTLAKGFRALATRHGLEHFLGPVRPVGMPAGMPVQQWADTRDSQGEPLDFWLRVHLRLGARELGVAPRSQRIEGSLAQWRAWTGVTFDRPGPWQLEEALQPVEVDLANDRACYHDPSIWVGHSGLRSDTPTAPPCDPATLRQYLAECLPAYMLPDELLIIGQMPLTENGKPDLRRLHGQAPRHDTPASVASSPLQHQLQALWQRILACEGFGVDHDFFVLGGQSLKVIEMLAAVEQAHGRKVRLQAFYRQPTIRHLEQLLQAQEPTCSK
ncbi:non-ribosomal peptide synthetase [Pseudomonas entomophila]|uniref:non-ribosomal peptide synthetase n=1 Tax=Pseudomonas entomophila TaxID=312306 RepID=UPI001F009BE4|nr:amino acid adenylation domain-containing protein [Pseudomonas entomophila]MCG8291810.1 amino acid adenylation domain-containing protein [Pseudomonas entomophila]